MLEPHGLGDALAPAAAKLAPVRRGTFGQIHIHTAQLGLVQLAQLQPALGQHQGEGRGGGYALHGQRQPVGLLLQLGVFQHHTQGDQIITHR